MTKLPPEGWKPKWPMSYVLESAPGIPYAHARAQLAKSQAAGYPPPAIDEREWQVVGYHGSYAGALAHLEQRADAGREELHRIIMLTPEVIQ